MSTVVDERDPLGRFRDLALPDLNAMNRPTAEKLADYWLFHYRAEAGAMDGADLAAEALAARIQARAAKETEEATRRATRPPEDDYAGKRLAPDAARAMAEAKSALPGCQARAVRLQARADALDDEVRRRMHR
jgi:hypothetical protein